MYGPVATMCVLYVDGFFASNSFAYSSGTGIVIGITSAAATTTASGRDRLNSTVWSSGVLMPEIGLTPLVGLFGAPSIELKYVPYWPPTFTEKNRSKAYLMSFDVTSRFTGGLNFTPGLIFTVIFFRSSEICGLSAARSGRDRKSTRLNSSHTVIYTLSLHDALPIYLAVHRRAELHARLDLHGDLLQVLGDLRLVRRQVRQRVLAAGLVAVQRAMGRVGDLVAALVVGVAGVEVVDVRRAELSEDATRLPAAGLLLSRVSPSRGTAGPTVGVVAAAGGDHQREHGYDAREEQSKLASGHATSFHCGAPTPRSSNVRQVRTASAGGHFVFRGFKASCRPSPTRLNARTVSRSARPGNVMNHHASRKIEAASESIAPQLGVPGSIPTPRNDRAAS